MVMDEESSGAELWVSEELITPVELDLDISEEESATLIYDEIGLPGINREVLEELEDSTTEEFEENNQSWWTQGH